MKEKDIKENVRQAYGEIALKGGSCCESSSCCGGSTPEAQGLSIGYSTDDMANVPEGSNMGLGCGNPVALSALKPGQTVLDLGSGAGFDCFLAAQKVGENGKVIGVDMTPEMVEKSTRNAREGGYENVEFRRGEIESLPVEDSSVDVVISNCVINLSTQKDKVFSEVYRVLKPNGRMMISDIVLGIDIPDKLKRSVLGYVACVSGADPKKVYLKRIQDAGFVKVLIVDETPFPTEFLTEDGSLEAMIKETGLDRTQLLKIMKGVISIKVRAEKWDRTGP